MNAADPKTASVQPRRWASSAWHGGIWKGICTLEEAYRPIRLAGSCDCARKVRRLGAAHLALLGQHGGEHKAGLQLAQLEAALQRRRAGELLRKARLRALEVNGHLLEEVRQTARRAGDPACQMPGLSGLSPASQAASGKHAGPQGCPNSRCLLYQRGQPTQGQAAGLPPFPPNSCQGHRSDLPSLTTALQIHAWAQALTTLCRRPGSASTQCPCPRQGCLPSLRAALSR